MNPNFDHTMLDKTKEYIQQLETHTVSIEKRLKELESQLQKSEQELSSFNKRKEIAIQLSKDVKVLEKMSSPALMNFVHSGKLRFDILNGQSVKTCHSFIVLEDGHMKNPNLKVKFTSVSNPNVFIKRHIKIRYMDSQEVSNLRPLDIIVVQSSRLRKGVYDYSIWAYEEYRTRNDQVISVPVEKRPIKKSKV